VAAIFQDVNGPKQIVFNHLATGSRTVHSGRNTWIRRGVDDPIDDWQLIQIAAQSHVSVENPTADFFESSSIQLRPRSNQIIDSYDLDSREHLEEISGEC
jgi:hypothetical protein